MVKLLYFMTGLFLGGIIGYIGACLISMGKEKEEDMPNFPESTASTGGKDE